MGLVMSSITNLLFPPIAPASAGATSAAGAREEIGDMIEALRAHLDMDVAFVSRQVGGTHRIFTHVAARGVAPLASGDLNPNENSLCWLVIQGKLPERVTDTSHYEAAACRSPTRSTCARISACRCGAATARSTAACAASAIAPAPTSPSATCR